MVSIPNEIITDEILPKLPAKSLVRFKCVSKSFNTLISSPEFIDLHLQQSLSSTANRLLIIAEEDCSNLYSFDIDSSNSNTTAIKIPLPRTLDYWLDDGVVSIISSFNGLLCVGLKCFFEDDIYDIYETEKYKQVVINPSTGVFREVPYKHTPLLWGNWYYHISFGFGYDDVNKDYKLVRITETVIQLDFYQGDELYNREVMVYSLNENTWKLVENVHRPSQSLQTRNGVLIKNHLLHWVFWDSIEYIIYCFDVRSDNWVDEVPMVNLFTDRMADFEEKEKDLWFEVGNLGVVDGCLCFTATSNLCDVVWMMKEYGVKESWIKLFEFSSFRRYRNPRDPCCYFFDGPYGYRQGAKQEVLVRRPRKIGGLFWLNIGSGDYGKTEEISGIPVYDEACFFTGSLVPIAGSKPIISPED